MSILSLAGADFFVVIALGMIICLARRNVLIHRSNNLMFVHLSLATILLMLLEIITILLEQQGNPRLNAMSYLSNILGFSLSPALPLMILLFNMPGKGRKLRLQRVLLSIPLMINTAICIFSFKTGWVFSIGAQGQYDRGDLFLLPTAAAFYYYGLAGIQLLSRKEYDAKDKQLLCAIYLLPAIATVLQILFKDLLVLWSSVAVSLMLFYIFLLSTQFKFDPVTGMRNRAQFEQEMRNHQKQDRVLLMVFDLNNLKTINDQYGHKAGDEALQLSSRTIQQCLSAIGILYRIGGDEFCALCKDVPIQRIQALFHKIDIALERIELSVPVKVRMAHGFSYYTKGKDESVQAAFMRADKAMYANKAQSKITSFNGY